MLNELLEEYKNNPNILYIYEHGLQIFGLFEDVEDRDFILVSKDKYIPDNFEKTGSIYKLDKDSCHFLLYFVEDWFEEVLNCSIVAWECACLPKKYIIKEHVKLLLQTDPLKLRLNFENKFQRNIKLATDYIQENQIITGMKILWDLVKDVIFSNQILENHKIVNFKEVADSYKQVVNGLLTNIDAILENFEIQLEKYLKLFKNSTDGILNKYKINHLINAKNV